MNKEIIAYENLWEQILLIEKFASKIIFFDAILLEEEYNLKKSYEILGNQEGHNFILNEDYTEKNRIYLSDKLYGLYFTYRAILLRVNYLYYKGKEDNNLKKYIFDKGVRKHLETVLKNEEIEDIFSRKFGGLGYINDLFKNMILNEIKNLKDKNDKSNIEVGGDIIIGNNNKSNNGNIGNKKNKQFFNSLTIYFLLPLLLILIGWGYSYLKESKKVKEEFIYNYQELTTNLIPFYQNYSCSKLPVNKDDEITRQNIINKTDKINEVILKLKNNYKKINDTESVRDFPYLLNNYILEVKAFECRDLLNKKNILDYTYKEIVK